MIHSEIRAKFLQFFKDRGHTIVPSSSLLPDDPSVLFTTAGMQQFKPYYVGKADPMHDFGSCNTVSIQKCIRTSDIDEVGDERHLTFFEMLGNFSFGGYFKEKAIEHAYDFIVKEMELKIDYVTVFEGEEGVPADEESEKIWHALDPNITIKRFGRADNFWGPTGDEGPCGPTTEIYVDGIEIWNIVFNQYYKLKKLSPGPTPKKSEDIISRDPMMTGIFATELKPLEEPGIDTGMGLERLALVSQFPGQVGDKTVFDTDLLAPLIQKLPQELDIQVKRIIADHLRASAFLMLDGVMPSNKEQGYILRRLLRRALVQEHLLNLSPQIFEDVILAVIENYKAFYPELENKSDTIIDTYFGEREKFNTTLKQGLKELSHIDHLDASDAFKLYESFGLPYEVIKDVAGEKAKDLTREAFNEEFKKHQEKSRAGAEKKFGGHGLLLDTGELKAANEEELVKVTRLHTATHLLQAALRKVLGNNVSQAGSDITAERLRFDFTFPRKLTPEEIKKTENLVNEVIQKDLPVNKETLPHEEAVKTGALHFFKIKYPPMVDVYTVGGGDEWFSKEFCGGPHVTHTGEIGQFKIIKEEAASAGVRRIKAMVD